MANILSLARTMYWLEISINQGKTRDDWDDLPAADKRRWIESAESVERITKK